MQRGDLRWFRFSRPDKRRPVLLLTRDSALEFPGEVTVAPVTTRVRGIPLEVFLSKVDGMPRECAVNLDHVQMVSRGKIGALVTRLDNSRMAEVQDALTFALGFRVEPRPS